MKSYVVGDKSVVIVGQLLKTAKLRDEYYVPVDNVEEFIGAVRSSAIPADLLTFVQDIHDTTPKHAFFHDHDSLAVLPLSTYDHWLTKQIGFKPRNKIKKALKSGVVVRAVQFDDGFVSALMRIYNESPIRQGQRNWHYGKNFETVKREHITFLECSDFIGAFYQEQLIGFAKITHVKDYSIVMAILAMMTHRDKAPTNALMAKAVELCAARGSRFLNYSCWGRREGLNEFKEAHGFQRFEIPRFFVPLTFKGRIALRGRLHRKPVDYLPGSWVQRAAGLRSKWTEFRFRNHGLAAEPAASLTTSAQPPA